MADPSAGLRRRTVDDGNGDAPDGIAALRDVIPDMSAEEAGRRLDAAGGDVHAALDAALRGDPPPPLRGAGDDAAAPLAGAGAGAAAAAGGRGRGGGSGSGGSGGRARGARRGGGGAPADGGAAGAALAALWRLFAAVWAAAAAAAAAFVRAAGIGRPDGLEPAAVAAAADLGGGSEEAAQFIADFGQLVAPTVAPAAGGGGGGGGDGPPPPPPPPRTLPPFYAGSYAAALGAARRAYTPLIVYLHAPAHPDVPAFAGHILCHPALAPVLASATLFGADVAHPTGRTLAHALAPSTYPFLAVLLPPASAASGGGGGGAGTARRAGEFTAAVYGARVSAREGRALTPPAPLTSAGVDGTAVAVGAYLTRALRRAAPPLRAARATATAATTARALRAEQDRAYADALDADRRREEAAAAAAAADAEAAAAAEAATAREAAEAEAAAAAAEAASATRRGRLDALGAEPPRGAPGTCRVRLRLPGGGTADRRFGGDAPMGHVWDWVGGWRTWTWRPSPSCRRFRAACGGGQRRRGGPLGGTAGWGGGRTHARSAG
ncbi:hypothetical protein BU14_1074s0001 [Porphyra umbilicalis]|uniref:UBX domain-containing protein n=1 Tax=Porphyra umbilicalis TaxID=2786 RepID=A0A1X6NNA6_PORUM|nr:hypothetical protein BU14_1074s0001 [Porphyra umbilicalis]|eukprot:OSX69843.1 hypothetical protein BU14_1074s0001 [Porphyra umbilicalis]